MSKEEKTAYSKDELKEFEEIILQKLALAKEELHSLKETLARELEPIGGKAAKICHQFGKCLDSNQKWHLWNLCGFWQTHFKRAIEGGAPYHALY